MRQSHIQLKNRIRSIENTKKVTSAMEMISMVKLNRIYNVLSGLKSYTIRLESLLYDLLDETESFFNPFLERREKIRTLALCVVTSDSGLCAGYNNNVVRIAEEFIRRQGDLPVKLICVGKKGFNHFRKRQDVEILHSYLGLHGRFSPEIADEISKKLIRTFLHREVDEVDIAYTHLERSFVVRPQGIKFLNIDPKPGKKTEYICEPDKEGILAKLIPEYLSMQFRLILLSAFASEHSARTLAMKTATDNARDLLEELILQRNKLRQAKITQDMTEIISSAEALKA
jgi:F-type H+-transporting ATPase subunit gamma